MASDVTQQLHARVAGLEAEVQTLRSQLSHEAPVSVREALLVEAERSAHLGSWMWDLQTGDVFWSDEMFRILGRDPTLDIASADEFFGAIHPEDLPQVRACTQRSIELGVPERIEFRLVRGPDDVREIVMNGAFIFGADGAIERMVGSCLDVTRSRSLETQLRQAQKMEAIGRLAGGVAHDFNNLLTAILGNASLMLAEDANNARAAEVVAAAEQAAALTKQLLSFSRHALIERRPLQLNEVTTGALTLIRRVIGEAVSIEFEPGEPLWPIDADPNQLGQILMNLAVNARDALPDGGRIVIATRNTTLPFARRPAAAQGNQYVELRVADDGVGMSEQARARAFEPFFTSKRPGEGTGLGLATVLGIVSQHDGAIELDSKLGTGTQFRIYFPRTRQPPRPAPYQGASASPRGRGERVLVVEDERLVGRVVEDYLESGGYDVVSARTGAQAAAAAGDDVALLVTDLVLPDMNGIQLAEELRARRADLRVLFMTGYGADTGNGARGPLIQKPFTREQLLFRVEHVLRNR